MLLRWQTVLIQKLIVVAFGRQCLRLCGVGNFIAVFTKSRQWSEPRSLQYIANLSDMRCNAIYSLCYRKESMLQYTVYVTVCSLCYSVQYMLQNTVYVTVQSLLYRIQSRLEYAVSVTVYSLCYRIQSMLQYTAYITVYSLCYSTKSSLPNTV